MRDPDLRIYAVLDPERCRQRDPLVLLEAAANGGATLVQLRAKQMPTRALMALAEQALGVLERYRIPLVINDRVDVALAVGAAGVHLGKDDMPAAAARRLLGDDRIVGVTIHHGDEADLVDRSVADYAGIGPVYVTASKDPGDPPIGPGGLRLLRQRLDGFPICGIAGIDYTNAAPVIEAGADGIAVISDIFMADDVEAATARLRRIVDVALAA